MKALSLNLVKSVKVFMIMLCTIMLSACLSSKIEITRCSVTQERIVSIEALLVNSSNNPLKISKSDIGAGATYSYDLIPLDNDTMHVGTPLMSYADTGTIYMSPNSLEKIYLHFFLHSAKKGSHKVMLVSRNNPTIKSGIFEIKIEEGLDHKNHVGKGVVP